MCYYLRVLYPVPSLILLGIFPQLNFSFRTFPYLCVITFKFLEIRLVCFPKTLKISKIRKFGQSSQTSVHLHSSLTLGIAIATLFGRIFKFLTTKLKIFIRCFDFQKNPLRLVTQYCVGRAGDFSLFRRIFASA